MAEENQPNDGNKRVHRHLSLPEHGNRDNNTIYKLRLSMNKRLSLQESTETPSPVEAGEVRDLLHRLVEIDNESRDLLSKVFSLLEKDENLEEYVKKRIEDPKVSKMWKLVEQVLAFQEGETNLNDMIMENDDDDLNDDYVTCDRGIKVKDEKENDEKKNDRFKVKNIGSNTGGAQGGAGGGSSRGTGGANSSTTAAATSSTKAASK